MPPKAKVASISPILAVRDVMVSVAFYVRYLNFSKVFVMEDHSYGVVELDGQTIHFVRTEDMAALRATRSRVAVYIAVRNIDPLWHKVYGAGPPTQIRSLETKPWGMREFHVMDPDGCLLRFGEEHG
ncbi:bleomycin resistance protein [Rhodospirillum sp. A1_3_36]|uniref:bleomycin resistance protein n=1 Tax=Rhodospirillum sp. A1_3_36 TaxID=3391666 RepID=UPI0039A42E3C